jgi:selenocysteine lyase/cysteine desulfurase
LVAALGGILTNAGSIMKQVRNVPPVEEEEPVEQEPEHPIIGKNDSEKESNAVIDQATEEQEQARNEAMEMFGSDTPGIKTPETQEALDALAEHIEPTDEETEEVPEEENPLVGKYDAEKNSSPFIDYDEEASLPMFDVPVDEEESDQDEELVIEEPKPLYPTT